MDTSFNNVSEYADDWSFHSFLRTRAMLFIEGKSVCLMQLPFIIDNNSLGDHTRSRGFSRPLGEMPQGREGSRYTGFHLNNIYATLTIQKVPEEGAHDCRKYFMVVIRETGNS